MATFLLYRTRPEDRNPSGLQAVIVTAADEATARAVANAPKVLLADEPTGNLDTHSADDVFALLREFNRRQHTTFLIVTHDPRLAARCDRIIELVDGRIVADQAVASA